MFPCPIILGLKSRKVSNCRISGIWCTNIMKWKWSLFSLSLFFTFFFLLGQSYWFYVSHPDLLFTFLTVIIFVVAIRRVCWKNWALRCSESGDVGVVLAPTEMELNKLGPAAQKSVPVLTHLMPKVWWVLLSWEITVRKKDVVSKLSGINSIVVIKFNSRGLNFNFQPTRL